MTNTAPRIPCEISCVHGWPRIEVQFEPEAGRKRGKKINIILCAPKKCNLRGKTEKERLLLNRYLKAWGILRGAEE